MSGKLFCVGCGPGDSELLTLKAANIIRTADTIFCPTSRVGRDSMALSIVKPILNERNDSYEIINVIFPMVKDKTTLQKTWSDNTDQIAKKCKDGNNVVYITVGDPSLYSTFTYIHRELKERYPSIEIEIIPGIASMFAFASQAKISLAEGDDMLAIIPACYDLNRIKSIASSCDTLIFLKDGRYFNNVIEMLKQSGFSDDSLIAIAQDVSAEGEVVKISKLNDVKTSEPAEKYFSIMVVKRD
ncbi:MAG: precorrin-2 C(20)-methyltransferase [Thaumarchaeota archaeon]|nr:precorrin-2 C(20)-methyltransferase [Nitrososphaerota archaeon]|tara:strand:+ start:222 stop:950 length:729 start_codon:yes stop_codon:yes gene_type:complete